MIKFGNRPKLKGSRWTSNSAKVFLAAASALVALCAIVVICLIVFGENRFKTVGSNGSVAVSIPSAKKVSPAKLAEKDKGEAPLLSDAKQPTNGTITAEHSVSDQTPTPALSPIATPAPVPQPESKAFVSDSELLRGGRPDSVPENPERKLPKAVRKNLEKKRREAERKRSRLEDMYQKHLISSEAYKQGEKEYRSEIEKYRSEVNADRSVSNSLE
jgi:hypothetical protein